MGGLDQVLSTRLVDEGSVAAETGAWQTFCAAIRDGNPMYWHESVAEPVADGRVSPPAMIAAWTRPYPWYPGAPAGAARPVELHHRLKEALGYPFAVVEGTDLEILGLVKAGDRISAEQQVEDCSEEREGRLGPGRNWTIHIAYRNQRDALVATERIRFFAYRKADHD